MLDSYEKFLSKYITKEDFFNFGIEETIYMPYDKVEQEWNNLKEKIQNSQEVFIRGYGRNASGTYLFFDFYKEVFNHTKILKDPTNNQRPTRLIEDLTKLKKNKDIQNYQVSHIFGRTKNIYAFTAPWNIVFMPKILDPFTGHEAKGSMVQEYQTLFKQQSYSKFSIFINEFNDIMSNSNFITKMHDYLENLNENNDVIIKKFKKIIIEEFSPIIIK